MSRDKKKKIEYGDFQTPPDLTDEVCRFLHQSGIEPRSIVEPTCGEGNFLLSVMECFPQVEMGIGLELNAEYIERTNGKLCGKPYADRIKVIHEDFFNLDWKSITSKFPEPILVIGNPPWVTNSSLGVLSSQNLPQKTNFQKHNGLDALTGKSNFDISEWMAIRILDWFSIKSGCVALLCKTAVARKILQSACQNRLPVVRASLYLIDAKKYFEASVDAGLLVCELGEGSTNYDCSVYERLDRQLYLSTFGTRGRLSIANLDPFKRWKHLEGRGPYQWRSGIKHDCSKIMELRGQFPSLTNGLGETIQLESLYVFPLLKSSDVANGRHPSPSRSVIVTQNQVGKDTQPIREEAPKTWAYLKQHQALFEKRKSSIYKGKPPFSIFGVGDYAFAPWKVAISGLYKQLSFRAIGPREGKPVMLDDTCYFIPCNSEGEARLLEVLLNSQTANQFFGAFIFWDAKRPITASLLNRLDLFKLASELGRGEELNLCLESHAKSTSRAVNLQNVGYNGRLAGC